MGQVTAPVPSGPLARVGAALRRTGDQYRRLGAVPAARNLLLATTVSNVGDRVATIALVALSYRLGDGALGVGAMLALNLLPRFVLQGPAGALVDRYPGPRPLVLSHVLLAALSAAFVLLESVPSIGLLYALVLATGIVRTVAIPAFELELMAVTPPAEYGTANALHAQARTAGDLFGPLLGAALLPFVGASPLFVLNALSFLAVAAVVRFVGSAGAAPSASDPAPDGSGTAAPGFLALLRRRDVAAYLALVVAEYVLYMGAIAVFVVRARDFDLGEAGVGLFYTALGVGSLVGGFAAGGGTFMGPRVFAIPAVGAVVGALGVALFGAAGGLLFAVAALAVTGSTGDLEEVAALTSFQHRLPAGSYGRFLSLFLMATGLGGMVGSLLGPLLAERVGVAAALAALAVPVVSLALILGLDALHADRPAALGSPLAPEPEVAGFAMFDPAPDPTSGPDAPVALRPTLSRLSRLA